MEFFLRMVMRVARRMLKNTPIQQLRLTTLVYRRFAQRAFGDEPLEVNFRNVRIKYPGGDYTTLPTLIEGSYESLEIDSILDILDSLEDKIVAIDVGANVGIWTILLASHSNVEKVFAFEPSPANLAFLEENIKINQVSHKVTVIDAAVSNSEGTAKFDDEGNGATMRLSMQGQLVVPTITLDQFTQDQKIGLIKIDVEGFEVPVLEGGWQTIIRDRPVLCIEYSLSQTKSAGNSWDEMCPKLIELYGDIEVISAGKIRRINNYSTIENDGRLLNLLIKEG